MCSKILNFLEAKVEFPAVGISKLLDFTPYGRKTLFFYTVVCTYFTGNSSTHFEQK